MPLSFTSFTINLCVHQRHIVSSWIYSIFWYVLVVFYNFKCLHASDGATFPWLSGHSSVSQDKRRKNDYTLFGSLLLAEPIREGGGLMRISARNMLKGKVTKVIPGAVNTEIEVELPGGAKVVSIITKTSAEGMGLAVGKEVYAVIKASNVMIAID